MTETPVHPFEKCAYLMRNLLIERMVEYPDNWEEPTDARSQQLMQVGREHDEAFKEALEWSGIEDVVMSLGELHSMLARLPMSHRCAFVQHIEV